MKKKGAGTPATTTLDRAGVPYTLHAYHHDAAATNFGEEAATQLGVDPRSIFKTLVSAGRRGLQVQLAPGDLITVTGGRFASLTLPA